MKKIVSILALASLLGASSIASESSTESSHYEVMPYAALRKTTPGVGILVRTPEENKHRFETSFDVESKKIKGSLSYLYNLSLDSLGVFYMGTGVGCTCGINFSPFTYDTFLPFFTGLEGNMGFTDFGFDFFPGQKLEEISPTWRAGIKF